MKDHLSQQDIVDYALNELDPRERLYVESLMLGSDALREDACEMIEMARLLEQGFAEGHLPPSLQAEFDFSLGDSRRRLVLEHSPSMFWKTAGRVALAMGSLAACVAFSVAAPVVWNLAFRQDLLAGAPGKPSEGVAVSTSPVAMIGGSEGKGGRSSGSVLEVSAAVVVPSGEPGVVSYPPNPEEEFVPVPPLGVLPPAGGAFSEMPLPGIPVELN
ncbi:MAG: hypothetical protein RLZZ244_2038 [Verrucomicrobiota bacterium]